VSSKTLKKPLIVIPEFFFLHYQKEEKYQESHWMKVLRYRTKIIRIKFYELFFRYDVLEAEE